MSEETQGPRDQVRNADEAQHESWSNQHKHEPVPASRHAEPDGEANRPAAAPDVQDVQDPQDTEEEPPEGKAVRDMMGGPVPQGDVPDAPGVQVAATFEEDDRNGDGPKARYVANAVPGKPDGEVDTRS